MNKTPKTIDLFHTSLDDQKKDIYTVSRLNFEVAGLLSGTFVTLWITGEISNLSNPPSGHIYFVLKDAKSQVQCVMFKAKKQLLKFTPQNGDKVILQATVGLYEARGNYQLTILKMSEDGVGHLHQAFEKLKNKLTAEGWFEDKIKQPIPKIPKTVGIITSPDGSVVFDIISIFKRRFPATVLIIYPSPVQGEGSAHKIASMIKIANKRNECEVLIVARGGGSLEDLWAFNELEVAQAIYQSSLPIVSAVGHESDVTIADFVADMRAPTPSAAAELLSENQDDLRKNLYKYQVTFQHKIQTILDNKQQSVAFLLNNFHVPKINNLNLKLDELFLKLKYQTDCKISLYKHTLNESIILLNNQNPVVVLQKNQQKLYNLQKFLTKLIPNITQLKIDINNLVNRLSCVQNNQMISKQQILAHLSKRLDIASPLKTLSRGYAIAYNIDGTVITDASMLKTNDKLWLRLEKTAVLSSVIKTIKIDEI